MPEDTEYRRFAQTDDLFSVVFLSPHRMDPSFAQRSCSIFPQDDRRIESRYPDEKPIIGTYPLTEITTLSLLACSRRRRVRFNNEIANRVRSTEANWITIDRFLWELFIEWIGSIICRDSNKDRVCAVLQMPDLGCGKDFNLKLVSMMSSSFDLHQAMRFFSADLTSTQGKIIPAQ